MQIENSDIQAYSIGPVLAAPWEVASALRQIEESYRSAIVRWVTAKFDTSGFVLVAHYFDGDKTADFFLLVNYDYAGGRWSREIRDELAEYLDQLGVWHYLGRDDRHRFLASIPV